MADLIKTPGLFGAIVKPRDLSSLLYRNGWTEILNNVRMAATVDAESDRYAAAVGQVNANGSQDWGMFQINNRHFASFNFTSQEEFYQACIDPERAAPMARILFVEAKHAGGRGFEPWFAYGTQRWHDRLPTACRGLCNMAAVYLYGSPVV